MQKRAAPSLDEPAALWARLLERRLARDRGTLGPTNRRDDRSRMRNIPWRRRLIVSESAKSVRSPRELREQFAPFTHRAAPS
jgi:hypothetical protein